MRHHRKRIFCSSHPLPWRPAVADWFKMESAGEVHFAEGSRGERDPLVGCGLPWSPIAGAAQLLLAHAIGQIPITWCHILDTWTHVSTKDLTP